MSPVIQKIILHFQEYCILSYYNCWFLQQQKNCKTANIFYPLNFTIAHVVNFNVFINLNNEIGEDMLGLLSKHSLYLCLVYWSISFFRNADGVCPVCFLKALLKYERLSKPVWKQASVTLFPCSSSFFAWLMRYWLTKSV